VFDVFVSHAHADQPRVDALIRQLQAEQIDVWWDAHPPIGGNGDDELESAMVAALALVAMLASAAPTGSAQRQLTKVRAELAQETQNLQAGWPPTAAAALITRSAATAAPPPPPRSRPVPCP
jgi:hypothetical protein